MWNFSLLLGFTSLLQLLDLWLFEDSGGNLVDSDEEINKIEGGDLVVQMEILMYILLLAVDQRLDETLSNCRHLVVL